MTKMWAISLCALALAGAWAGCASSPMSGTEDSGEAPSTAGPDVVVIGSKQDASPEARLDAATPTSPVKPAADAAGPPPTEAPLEPVDAGGATVKQDASAPDAAVRPPESGPIDAGSALPPTEPTDAGAPPTRPPAEPPPVDAGPPLVPDAGRVGCLAGTYKGSFEGEISALLGAIRIDVAGDMTIEVELSGTGEHLMIRNGILQGTDTSEQKNPLFARISGSLNCATKKLENGVISDGTYNRVDPVWPVGPPTTTTFAGTATGIYSTSPPAAVGTWTVKNASGSRTSMGTFNVTLQ